MIEKQDYLALYYDIQPYQSQVNKIDSNYDKEQQFVVNDLMAEGLGNCSINHLFLNSKQPLMVMVINKEALEILQASNIGFYAEQQDLSPSEMHGNNGYLVVVSQSDVNRVQAILERTSSYVKPENLSEWTKEGKEIARLLDSSSQANKIKVVPGRPVSSVAHIKAMIQDIE